MCVGLVLLRTGLVGVSMVMGRQFRVQGCQTLALVFVIDLVVVFLQVGAGSSTRLPDRLVLVELVKLVTRSMGGGGGVLK